MAVFAKGETWSGAVSREGGLGKVYQLFPQDLNAILQDMNQTLVA